MASLDIVIVDYRAGALLRDCLRSLEEAPPVAVKLERVIVVDNAPWEESITSADAPGLPLRVIPNVNNRGFAAACNQGAVGSSADYLLFLNPDTRIVAGSLDAPVAFLERREEAETGIVGIQLLDDDGTVGTTCFRFPRSVHFLNKAFGLDRLAPRLFPSGAMVDWDHGDTRQVDQVMGAFFLVRRTLFERLGGFDERFFVYYEEMDFSLRALQAGYRTIFLADAQAHHSGCGTTDKVRAQRLFYTLRSRTLYGRKHFGRGSLLGLTVVSAVVEPVTRLASEVLRRSWSAMAATMGGYSLYWKWLFATPTDAEERGSTSRP